MEYRTLGKFETIKAGDEYKSFSGSWLKTDSVGKLAGFQDGLVYRRKVREWRSIGLGEDLGPADQILVSGEWKNCDIDPKATYAARARAQARRPIDGEEKLYRLLKEGETIAKTDEFLYVPGDWRAVCVTAGKTVGDKGRPAGEYRREVKWVTLTPGEMIVTGDRTTITKTVFDNSDEGLVIAPSIVERLADAHLPREVNLWRELKDGERPLPGDYSGKKGRKFCRVDEYGRDIEKVSVEKVFLSEGEVLEPGDYICNGDLADGYLGGRSSADHRYYRYLVEGERPTFGDEWCGSSSGLWYESSICHGPLTGNPVPRVRRRVDKDGNDLPFWKILQFRINRTVDHLAKLPASRLGEIHQAFSKSGGGA